MTNLNPELLSKIQVAADQAQAEKDAQEALARLEHYKARSEQLERRIKALLAQEGAFAEQMDRLREAVVAAEPYERVKYDVKDFGSRNEVSPVVKVSDWQIGEVIKKDETEGFGEFNFAIARDRVLGQYAPKIISWTQMHRDAGFPIHTLHVFSEADHISGNIHHELEITNEFTVMEATANAGLLLGEFLSKLSAHARELVVWEMSADNHGRLTRKNQAKQGALNNYSWLVHVIANQYLARHDNVKIIPGRGTKLLADVQGKKFLLQHGHSVKSWMGIPYYGLEREKAREAIKRMNTDKTFDYVSCGHWHVPGFVSGIIINGNLPGTTEFDHMLGRHAPPSQVSFMVHPKHGFFNFTPWKLQ